MYLHYSILLVYRGIISVESFQTTRGSAQSPTWFWILYTVNQCPFSCNYVAVNCKHVFYLNSTVQTLKSTAELTPLILSHYPYTGSVSSVEEAGAELTPSRSKSRLSLSDISPSRVSFLPRFLRSSFSRLLHREKEGFIYSEMGKRSVNSSFLLTQFSVMWNQTKPNHQKCVLHSFCYID